MRRFRGQPPEGDGRFAAGWISGVGSAVVVAGGVRVARWAANSEIGAVLSAAQQAATQPRLGVLDVLVLVVLLLLIAASAHAVNRMFGGVSV